MNAKGLISIIVPIYKGIQYIAHIVKQAEQNAKQIKNEVELVLINDFPGEKLPEYASDMIKIICVQGNVNRGIHGARIEGLKHSSGEYVLFLDQDDEIKENFLKSQLSSIGDKDAAVCRMIHNKRLHYTDTFVFEKVISKEFMLNNWCPIVSPGQVLIRRHSIPKAWERNILKNNGADDYFLWILMMGQEKRFALNEEILFEHRITGTNTSMNTNMMMDSEQEMINILLKTDIFKDSYKEALLNLQDSLRRIHIKQLDNINVAYSVLSILCDISDESIYEILGEKVAIYGAADIGMAFFKGIKKYKKLSICFIDRDAEYINADIPVYHLYDVPSDIDTVVIAVNGFVENIRCDILQRCQCQVLSIGEVIQKMKIRLGGTQ